MYQFSRSMYRELASRIDPPDDPTAAAAARREVLEACESTIMRLATDRRHFARPTKTLFTDVRRHFALADQIGVHMVIERYIELAETYLDSLPDDVTFDGRPRQCDASTRRGTPCRRDPLPGRSFCPSHKHLEATFGTLDRVPAAA